MDGTKETEKERRFSQKQYDMLLRCSEKKDMKEWNKWRLQNPKQDVLLEGADFSFSYLRNAQLNQQGRYDDQKGKWLEIKSKVYLKGAHFESAKMQSAMLSWADLENVNFRETRLDNARLRGARLKDAIAWSAHFQCTNLSDAILEGANLQGAYLEGAFINGAHLEGANFHLVYVDSSTLIWACKVDHNTNFSGVALDTAQIDPSTKQLLEYNIRRMNWEDWYNEQHWSLRWLVRKFWKISDYGMSTKQIIKTFFKLAFVFAIIYYVWGFIDYYLVGIKDYPGIVSDLFVLEDKQEAVSRWLVPFRAVYFSIVTMTTLGFGDMYANAHSFFRGLLGHTLLALQVILGYVLLGALVTRFAVLFTAGGPAGKFADEKGEKDETE